MRPPGACVVFTAVLTFALAAPLLAQQKEDWEGKTITDVLGSGFRHEQQTKNLDMTGLKRGGILTREAKDIAIKELFKTGKFQDVDVKAAPDPIDPKNKVIVTVVVTEYIIVEKVEFRGINEIPIATLKPSLRLSAGEPLNPYHLKQDREFIREQYLQKGYHFSSVEESTKPGTTGVILTWNVVEGPLVSVESIVFTGNITVDEDELRRFLLSKQNDRLFGLVVTSRNAFIERNLREDVDRVKLYYRLEGWLDIQHGKQHLPRGPRVQRGQDARHDQDPHQRRGALQDPRRALRVRRVEAGGSSPRPRCSSGWSRRRASPTPRTTPTRTWRRSARSTASGPTSRPRSTTTRSSIRRRTSST
jgi:outer membrane protein assembly factor BamA